MLRRRQKRKGRAEMAIGEHAHIEEERGQIGLMVCAYCLAVLGKRCRSIDKKGLDRWGKSTRGTVRLTTKYISIEMERMNG